MTNRPRVVLAAAVVVAAGLAVPAVAATDGGTAAVPVIKILSNRADLVSGGDALVEVVPPKGATASSLRVSVGSRDVTRAFGVRNTDKRLVGLVTGLAPGKNVLVARAGTSAAQIVITNYPSGGPVFAGRQPSPWFCNTEANGFGKPRDAKCTVPPKYSYLYQSTNPVQSGLQAYDPKNPPTDVATTTTDQGATVPFIVRLETGVIDRGWYQWAFLFDPAKKWTPQQPQRGWNRKLIWHFGGSCDGLHYQGNPPDVLSGGSAGYDAVNQLAKGFGLAQGSLQVLGNNCNIQISAEGVMMQQERIAEQYGDLRYTIGTGCSGGSMQQLEIGNAYPGLIDGLIPSCTFPDASYTSLGTNDNIVLSTYFLQTSPYLWANEQQQAAVYGQATIGGYTAAGVAFNDFAKPTGGCGASGVQPWQYDPQKNPRGTRCDNQDWNVGKYGLRTDGFARRPWANEGKQYGLVPLQTGEILPEQFVDLNEKVGGVDIDGNVQAARTTGMDKGNDKVWDILYRSGGLNDMRRLDLVPIIDVHGGYSSNLEFHPEHYSYRVRERLLKANGQADNHVHWRHPGGTFVVPPYVTTAAWTLMDEWLTSIERDTSRASLEDKVRRHRPAAAREGCWVGTTLNTNMQQCRTLYPYWGDIETASGQDIAAIVAKCQLKPLRKADYTPYGVTFTDAQWERLKTAFPHGVCDFSKPSIGQVPSEPWISYGAGRGEGRTLGPAPTSSRRL